MQDDVSLAQFPVEHASTLLNSGEKTAKYRRFRHFVLPLSNIGMQSTTFRVRTGDGLIIRICL
jgi:hypothetical protein